MQHTISSAIELSIINGTGKLEDYVPRMRPQDKPQLYPILNHRDGDPFLPPDLQLSHDSWQNNPYLEEHPYIAISLVVGDTQYTKALVDPFPLAYPAHQVIHHVADAIEMLEQYDGPANDWEIATMRDQANITLRKAMAGVHSLTEDQVGTLFDELLDAQLPTLTMVTALHVATGNDPHLKRIITDNVRLPQTLVFEEDAKRILERAKGKMLPVTMGHIAVAMGYPQGSMWCSPQRIGLEEAPIPTEHKDRTIRAAKQAGIPSHLIDTLQREL